MPSDPLVVIHADHYQIRGSTPCIKLLQRKPEKLQPRLLTTLPIWARAALPVLTWLYLAVLLTVWLMLYFGGDRWWLATLMLFGPRWIYGLPLLLLVPAAAVMRRRLWVHLAIGTFVLVGPIMGFRLSWNWPFAQTSHGIRVLTCNVKGKCTNNESLNELISAATPDIVALQGCWGDVQIQWPAGWQVCKEGEFLIASRYPLLYKDNDAEKCLPGQSPHVILHNIVQMPERAIDFCSVHLQSPHHGLVSVADRQTVVNPSESAKLTSEIEQRSRDSAEHASWAGSLSASKIIAGDFNMPVDSSIYRRDWSGYRNAFSEAGWGFGYTEWPTIRGFSWGVRIDHVLTGEGWRCRSCWVGPDIGSDHLPLIVDLVAEDPAP